MAREAERERYIAKTDDGKTYTILRYGEFVPIRTSYSPHSEIAGKPRFSTSTGLAVHFIDAETFKIVETDEIVRIV